MRIFETFYRPRYRQGDEVIFENDAIPNSYMIIIDNQNEQLAFLKNIHKDVKVDIDLPDNMSVFLSKNCTTPRYQLKTFLPDIKKVNDFMNADYIITPIPDLGRMIMYPGIVVNNSMIIRNVYGGKIDFKERVKAQIKLKFGENAVIEDILYVEIDRTSLSLEVLQAALICPEKLCAQSNLDTKIAMSMNAELDEDSYKMIESMIQSNDVDSQYMGLKMLESYSFEKYALELATIVFENGYKISQIRARNSVGFKNLMKMLGNPTLDYMQGKDNYDFLIFINKVYTQLKTDESKQKLQIKHNELKFKLIEERLRKMPSSIPDNIKVVMG